MSNGWKQITQTYHDQNRDKIVIAWWNGISPDNSGRQECRFLTDRTPAFGRQYALNSPWIDQAKTFASKAEAEAFLASQTELRGTRLKDDWQVCTLAELEARIGYRTNPASAIIGNNESEIEPPAPAP